MAATEQAIRLTQIAAEAAEDKLAVDVVAVDVSELLPLADVFLLASAPNDRQVQAIVDNIEERLRLAGVRVLRREGEKQGRWILLDFGDLVVHVQHEEERMYYQLERLWRDCPVVPLRAGSGGAAGTNGAGGSSGAGDSNGPAGTASSGGTAGTAGSSGAPDPAASTDSDVTASKVSGSAVTEAG